MGLDLSQGCGKLKMIKEGISVSESIKKGIYQHFKGERYEVIDVARHSETGEEHVVYRALYGDRGLWLRPLTMFMESVERNGISMQRFTWLGDP
jgi:hypothetical protein